MHLFSLHTPLSGPIYLLHTTTMGVGQTDQYMCVDEVPSTARVVRNPLVDMLTIQWLLLILWSTQQTTPCYQDWFTQLQSDPQTGQGSTGPPHKTPAGWDRVCVFVWITSETERVNFLEKEDPGFRQSCHRVCGWICETELTTFLLLSDPNHSLWSWALKRTNETWGWIKAAHKQSKGSLSTTIIRRELWGLEEQK